jgi:hypothetical protein
VSQPAYIVTVTAMAFTERDARLLAMHALRHQLASVGRANGSATVTVEPVEVKRDDATNEVPA